ncbi:unknown [Firmicutes bacterium CAG:822]|nr:unknown [Firmicutes bacterium CAG:822]
MEILDVLQIILNGKFLLDDDRIFVEKCVRNRSIIDLDRICDIISNYFIHVRTKSTDNVCGYVCFDMLSSLKYCFLTYLNFKEGISDDYKVYPINVNDGSEELFKEYLKDVFSKYFCDNVPLDYHLEVNMVELLDKVNLIKCQLLDADIKPFYGDEYYLKHRITYTTSKMLEIINDDNISEDIRDRFEKFCEVLCEYISEFPNLVMKGDFEYQKMVYEVLESYYKNLLIIENSLSTYTEKIWNDRLLSDRFCGLAHGFTKGEFLPDEADKICACYFDERYITIIGDYGYLYPMYMDKCDMISASDAYSYFITKDEFIRDIETWSNKLLLNGLEYNFCNRPLTYFGDKTMVYRYPNYTKLLTPDMVLKENYQKALKNGLISDKRMPFGIGYNEIVFMDDNKEILPIGVWVRKGNEDIYKKALNLSKKAQLPLMVIDTLSLQENYRNQKINVKS